MDDIWRIYGQVMDNSRDNAKANYCQCKIEILDQAQNDSCFFFFKQQILIYKKK